jgi:hypothetical protein
MADQAMGGLPLPSVRWQRLISLRLKHSLSHEAGVSERQIWRPRHRRMDHGGCGCRECSRCIDRALYCCPFPLFPVTVSHKLRGCASNAVLTLACNTQSPVAQVVKNASMDPAAGDQTCGMAASCRVAWLRAAVCCAVWSVR